MCILLVALKLRPGIVFMGPLLTSIINELGLTHTQASLLTAIPTLLMGCWLLWLLVGVGALVLLVTPPFFAAISQAKTEAVLLLLRSFVFPASGVLSSNRGRKTL
ncbi:hypothetical protein ACJRW5_03550 [Pseudomonas sp. SH1-B]